MVVAERVVVSLVTTDVEVTLYLPAVGSEGHEHERAIKSHGRSSLLGDLSVCPRGTCAVTTRLALS